MLSWNVTPDPPRIIGPWFLWKLLIDQRHQGCGYGREAVKLVADIAGDHGASELLTSCVGGDRSPEPFYRQIGFVPTGEQDETAEMVLALRLRACPSGARSRSPGVPWTRDQGLLRSMRLGRDYEPARERRLA